MGWSWPSARLVSGLSLLLCICAPLRLVVLFSPVAKRFPPPYTTWRRGHTWLFIAPGSWLEENLPSSVTIEGQADLSPPASVHINHSGRFCVAQSQPWACHIAVTGSICPAPSPWPRPVTSGGCVCVVHQGGGGCNWRPPPRITLIFEGSSNSYSQRSSYLEKE